jgi:hypothetical protein
MANEPGNTASAVWHDLLAHRSDLIHSNDDQQLAAIEERLLDLPAPDLQGVVIKLRLIWDGQLHGQDQDSEHKLAVLADLHRLAA